MNFKRLIALALAAILLLSFVAMLRTNAAPSDTVYVRKHVSLVYDNSGSMSEDLDNVENLKWAYASYSTQIFAGLLNDTDSLTVTLMNENKGTKRLDVDLAADRQQQVDKLRELTNYAKSGTPLSSLVDAEQVLKGKGLMDDTQIGGNNINKNEQYWLVLTTDGQFENGNVTKQQLETELEKLLKKYSNLQLVYFGIGTEGNNSDQTAYDLRDSARLTAYPNFTAVYAQTQEQIVSTMQALANRISGRYSVTKGVQFNGTEVTLRISGETSPIRNIAILAQRTDTKLLSAVDEDGNPLTVARPANEQYPRNNSYDNIAEGTKGAHTALITCPDGKFQPGTVKLTFSEPVKEQDFSLMYEPAVYVSLKIQQKDAAGNWVDVPYGQKVQSGKPIRVSYEICEDGTNTPLDAAKLPGVTTDHITCGDKVINRDGEFSAPSGTSTITATVSMMDGAYTVSTVRTLQAISLDDYTFRVSDPLVFYPDELAANADQHIDFTILYEGQPASGELLTDFSVDAGDLQGTFDNPGGGVLRYTPKHADLAPGEYPVSLCFLGQPVASQKVTVQELVISYSAKAGDDLALLSNELAGNLKPIVFTVTCHRGEENLPLAEEDATAFRIEAAGPDGTALQGTTAYVSGQLHFITNDTAAQPGDYTVTLYREDTALASAKLSILKYNATYTAEVFLTGESTVDLFDLRSNQNALAFVVYADGEPCTGVQLQAMLGQQLLLRCDPDGSVVRQVTVETWNNQSALIVLPTSDARNGFTAFLEKLQVTFDILFGKLKAGPLTVELTVQTEKGTQVAGQLELTYDAADLTRWIIIMVIVLLVLGFIAWMLFCNLARPRIRPGTFTYYYINLFDNGQAETSGPDTKDHKWRFYLWPTLEPESKDYFDLSFTAEARAFFKSQTPTCKLDVNDPAIFRYCYQTPGFLADRALNILDRVGTRKFIYRDLADALPTMPITSPHELADGQQLVYQTLDDRSFILRREDNHVELWIYSRGELHAESSEDEEEEI